MTTETPLEQVPPRHRWRFRLLGPARRRNHWIGMAAGALVVIGTIVPVLAGRDASHSIIALRDGLVPVILLMGLAACVLSQFGKTSALPVLAAVVLMLGGYYYSAMWWVKPDGAITALKTEGSKRLEATWGWAVLGAGGVMMLVADFTDPEHAWRRKKKSRVAFATPTAGAPAGTIPPAPMMTPPRPNRGA